MAKWIDSYRDLPLLLNQWANVVRWELWPRIRFSRAFNITYSSAEGANERCWTTSWGASTQMPGGLIMCHGDDFGLVLPPALAPVQVVVVVVKETDGPSRLCPG